MLNGKTALVTGGSRGIGRAIALKLASQGADIAVIYAAGAEKAQQVCDEITAMGRHAAAFQCDVADFAQVKQTVAAVKAEFGRRRYFSQQCRHHPGRSARHDEGVRL